MTGYDNILKLLSRGHRLPPRWGFPAIPLALPSTLPLRAALMFLHDTEGVAQLCRWYYSLLRAAPHVWRSLAGEETYDPSFVSLPSIWSPSLQIACSPNTDVQILRWTPGPSDSAVSGKISIANDVATLSLGGRQYSMRISASESGIFFVRWPNFLNCEAGLADYEDPSDHFIAFRPSRFDHRALVEVLDQLPAPLHEAGLLDSYLSLPRPEEKIAVAWMAVARLEENEE